MNEAQLNAARLHRAGEERQRRLVRDVAINESELNADLLQRSLEEQKNKEGQINVDIPEVLQYLRSKLNGNTIKH